MVQVDFCFKIVLVPLSGVSAVVADPLLAAALTNNADTFRKRRLALSLSPEIKVDGPKNKIQVLNARVNLSQRIDSYRLVHVCVVDLCWLVSIYFQLVPLKLFYTSFSIGICSGILVYILCAFSN
jgi:hypothetical protein